MAGVRLENGSIGAEIDSHGAELVRLEGRKTGREYLFDADPRYWKRHSPVLFPIVGSLKDKRYVYEGKEYTMSQHGFARDMEFSLAGRSENEVWYQLRETEQTLEQYPFAFRLSVGYRLEGRLLKVMWRVENPDSKTMYFSIGAHPAFFCKLTASVREKPDYIYVGEKAGVGFHYYHISKHGLALPEDNATLPCKLPATASLFARDALIVDNRQFRRLALADNTGKEYVIMRFDAPLFGLWAPKGVPPFICLEPWYGRCDAETFAGSLEERVHGNSLLPGEVFEAGYSIELPLER